MALTGTVARWFNRKGYGFINVLNEDSEHFGNDIFVHLSGISLKTDGYKSLYPGEYVSFDIGDNNDRVVCVNVTGMMGHPLLVEHPEYRYKYFPKNPRQMNSDKETQNDESVPDEVEPDDQVEPEQ